MSWAPNRSVHCQDARLERDLVEPLDHAVDALCAIADAAHRLHRFLRRDAAAIDGRDCLIGARDRL